MLFLGFVEVGLNFLLFRHASGVRSTRLVAWCQKPLANRQLFRVYDQLVAALNDNFSRGVFLVPRNEIIKIFLELFGILVE